MRRMESSAALLSDLPPVTPAFIRPAAVTGSGRSEMAAALAKAESHVQGHRYADALEALSEAHIPSASAPDLAQQIGDGRLEALALMQCSLVAERCGDPLLARFYGERARTLACDNGDRQTEARIVNNLGGLSFLLGEPEIAVAYLKESFALSLEIGNDADAAQAVSSLAQVHLRCGAPQLAEEQARHALTILAERADYVDERGNVHLVLGRALLEQSREDEAMKEFAAAEWLFESLGSASHVAAAWMAQGDLYGRRGDFEASTALFRRAAEALQDFNF